MTKDVSIMDLFTQLMSHQAWKSVESFVEDEVKASVDRQDSKTCADLTLAEICEERGLRKGLRKVISFAESKRDGV